MSNKAFFDLLQAGAAQDRAKRVAAAKVQPGEWSVFTSVPKDGTLVDVMFDLASAEPGAAEFFAPGCTRTRNASEPVIENVAFVNDGFRDVVDAEGARMAASAGGAWGEGNARGMAHGIISVSFTHWRPAAYPYVE